MSSSVLLVADPGAPAALAEDLSKELPQLLTSDSSSDWTVSVQTGSYRLTEQASLDDVLGGWILQANDRTSSCT